MFFVLNDAKPFSAHGYGTANHFALANITTIRPSLPYDMTCVLNVGDHPFITAPSYVYYKELRVESEPHVVGCITSGLWKHHLPADPAIIAQIKAGMALSPFIRRGLKTLPI